VAKITDVVAFGAAPEKVDRLGMQALLEEVKAIVTDIPLRVKEETDANGGAAVRKLIDAEFEKRKDSGWVKKQTGAVDWTKCHTVNGTRVCIGVEVQFSGRSDLIIVDIIHLRTAITGGIIDVGVLLVPSDRLGPFLTDRGPRLADAKRMIREARVEDLPLLVFGVEHDGPGPPLAKQPKSPAGQAKSRRARKLMAAEGEAPYSAPESN
jgi:hypothetical protein